MVRLDYNTVGTCTACERQDCRKTFVCRTCGEEMLVCMFRVGGFAPGEDICASCHFLRETGMDLYDYWREEGLAPSDRRHDRGGA